MLQLEKVSVRFGGLTAVDEVTLQVGTGDVVGLVNATDGPALFVGDTSHTRWGWDHGVPPGTFTSDHELNAVALEQLRGFVKAHPEIRVYVGHEL